MGAKPRPATSRGNGARGQLMRTVQEAKAALEKALQDAEPDNPVAATRKVASIAHRFRPETPNERDAFRHAVRTQLEPYFERRDLPPAKAVAWTVCDGVARDGSSGTSGDIQEEWAPPIPLGPKPPADLPSHVLPSPLHEHVSSVAASKQVPTALPFGLSLAAVSAAVAGKADVFVRSGWSPIPVNLYVAAVLRSAERKSPVEAEMMRPLRAWERKQEEELGPQYRAATERRKALKERLKRARREAAKATTDDDEEQALDDLQDARRRIEKLAVRPPPRLFTSDVTEEALGRLMADHHGRAAILSSEGDVLRIFAGRYSAQSAPSLGLLKAGWSGDPVRVDRVGRDDVHLPRPLLTVGLTVQPTLLRTLSNRDVLDGEGVLARFLWFAPPSMIGKRKTGTKVPGLDEGARSKYGALLRRLLETRPAEVDESGQWQPHRLLLTPGARNRLHAWEANVEGLLADGGDLRPVEAWGGKLVGQTVRLAGLLHITERAGRGADYPFSAPVTERSMERAVEIARHLIPHALHVLAGELELDPELELARYVLRRVREADDSELTERDLWHLTKGKSGINDMGDLRKVLSTLVAHRLVRKVAGEPTGGRPASPWIRLNPHARKNKTTSTRSPPERVEEPASGTSGTLHGGAFVEEGDSEAASDADVMEIEL